MRSSPASMTARLGRVASLSSADLSLLFLDLEGGGDMDVRRDVGGVVSLVGLVGSEDWLPRVSGSGDEYTDMAVRRRC